MGWMWELEGVQNIIREPSLPLFTYLSVMGLNFRGIHKSMMVVLWEIVDWTVLEIKTSSPYTDSDSNSTWAY